MVLSPQMRSFMEAYIYPSLIIKNNDSFTISGVNQAWLKFYRTSVKEKDFHGKPICQLIKKDRDRKVLRSIFNGILKTKESRRTNISAALFNVGDEAPDAGFSQLVVTPVLNDQRGVDAIICSFIPVVKQEGTAGKGDEKKNLEDVDSAPTEPVNRLREKSCLYNILLLDEHALTVEEMLEQAIRILSAGFSNSSTLEPAIQYKGKTYATERYSESDSILATETEVCSGLRLKIWIAYTGAAAAGNRRSLLKEQQKLIETASGHISKKLDQKILKQELKDKEVRLNKAYQLANIGIWEFDMRTHELEWSDITKQVHGFGPDYKPDVESTINLFKEGYNRQIFAQAAREAIEEEKPFDVELEIISGEGDERWIRAKAEPEYKDGICIRFYGISQNVTNRRKAEKDVMLNEQRFRSLVQDGSDMIAILDEEANYKYVSPNAESVLGIPAEDFIGTNALDYIHPEDQDAITEILATLSPGKQIKVSDFRFKSAEGNWRWIETILTNMTEDAAVGGLVANSRDITEKKQQEKKILQALKEKETLLAEIHHRVKNNLAVVAGLIQLQLADTESPELTDKLHESMIRIHTMASIHEQLYQSKSFSEVDFADNINSLVTYIQKTLQLNTRVKIDFNCEPISLNINQAIPCSLIVNEIATNIFKHAYPDREEGEIKVNLYGSGENIHLSISDDGVGLPEDFDAESSNSLGVSLIGVLSSQLEAEYHFKSDSNGTVFNLCFEKDEQKGIGNSLL